MPSPGICHPRSTRIQAVCKAAICSLLMIATGAWNQNQSTNQDTVYLPPQKATQKPAGGHNSDTRPGNKVSSGMSGGEEAAIAGGIAAAAGLTIWAVHHHEHAQPNTSDLLKKGPHVAENATMGHLIVDGLIGPNWPVGIDFQIEGSGSLTLDITTSEKARYHQVLTNDLKGRGITITRPGGLPDKLQAATFDVEAIAAAGSNGPPPTVRIYGIAAGPHAVGSIAIDQVSFGPSQVKMKQDAQYAFHSHSDFSNVCADLMFTGLKDNHIVMKQDDEKVLNPVGQDEHAQGSLATRGTAGQHLLQIRAWRGNSGDWVAAWSPDVVVLTK